MRFADTKLTFFAAGLALFALALPPCACCARRRPQSKQTTPRLCRAASRAGHDGCVPQHTGLARGLLDAMRRAELHRARRRS
jgi:hypothetical protein